MDRKKANDNRGRFEAVCSACGSRCSLPFQPAPGKPVYCDNCFGKQMANKGGKRPGKFGSGKPRFNDRQTFNAVCEKCGRSCQVPFKPVGGKPVYCDDCFGKGAKSGGGGGAGNVASELKMLNNKLDRIISLLTVAPASSAGGRTAPVAVKAEKKAVKKPAAKKAPAKKAAKKAPAKKAAKKAPAKKAAKKKK